MEVKEYNRSVDIYSDRLYRYIVAQVKDHDFAQDVVQESFIKLWEHVEEIDFKKAKAWLFRTAYRKMIDMIRKHKYEEKSEVLPERGREEGYSDLSYWLEKALQTLPEAQRSCILLRDYEGYAYAEIGEILDLSESQVKVYIYRGRIALKKYIGNPELLA